MSESPNKREALLRYLASDQADGDYVPSAFFLHFGEGFRSGRAAVDKHEEFFRFTGMDFAKIQFELPFPHVEISSLRDYQDLPFLEASFYAPQLEVVKDVVAALKSEALVVLTLYSPFMIAGNMVGQQKLAEDLQNGPDYVFKGLEILTESLLGFVRDCVSTGVDGFYHSTQGGESRRFKDIEMFLKWVKPSDHLIMNEIDEKCDFNILHICDYHQEFGGYHDLTPFLDYPGTVVNVSTDIGGATKSASELSAFFGRPYMGGLDRNGPLSAGTEEDAQGVAKRALVGRPAKFILGADCTVPGTTPWQNLRAAISAAHGE